MKSILKKNCAILSAPNLLVIVVALHCLGAVMAADQSNYVENRAIQMQNARVEAENKQLREALSMKDKEIAALRDKTNVLNAEIEKNVGQLSAKNTELQNTKNALADVKNAELSIRIDTFNSHSVEVKLGTVNDLINLRDFQVVDPDMTKHKGFDDDEGIPRRLLVRRKK